MRSTGIIGQYYNGKSSLQDAVKTLRTNIQFSSIDNEVKTLVITSVLPHEGKTTLSIYLGIAMAESGKRVLLVECDHRRPMLGNYLGVRAKITLADILSGRVNNAEEAVAPTALADLDLLDSLVMANPVEVLSSLKFWNMIEGLKSSYDIIILDTPPLGSFIEAAVLAAKADGTLLVVQSGTTDIKDAKNVVTQLEKAKARLLGVALNNVEASAGSYYDYYYYSGEKRKRGGRKPKKDDTQTSEPMGAGANGPSRRKPSSSPSPHARPDTRNASEKPKGGNDA